MKTFNTILVLLILSNQVWAKEYHVSKAGNDLNNGTKGSPFLTIQMAANVAQSGDIIIVHEGIYRERINPPRGGTSDNERIVYQAAIGETVIIKGSEVVKGWKKVENDTWKVVLPNRFFGKFNPFADVISGDWFLDKGRLHHTGAVYLNGKWLDEAAKKEEVLQPATHDLLWYAEVNDENTTIWAQFGGVDPNKELVEVNVRQAVFYPDQPGINFITVRGFIMEQAATPWAPPTAEQIGLIGPHWSKGWIIENNTIRYSVCSGISLGKYGDEFDNKSESSSKGYLDAVKRALASGWNKQHVGSHIVRNNIIHDCEQAGIVGSLGAIFSTISGNEIYNIHIRRRFSGMEMAGIKIHGAIDMIISNNHIYRTWRGIWLDWMAQGTRVTGNLLHDNETAHDLFLEVNHGPLIIDNNLFLSANSLRDISEGVAYVHNLFAGRINVQPNKRRTPYFKAHSTEIEGLKQIVCGDVRFYNNIFTSFNGPAPWPERTGPKEKGAFFGLAQYNKVGMPVYVNGNVFLQKAKPCKQAKKPLLDPGFDPGLSLQKKTDGWWLDIMADTSWVLQQRVLITSEMLGKAKIPGVPFMMPDGSPIIIDTDFLHKKRSNINPMVGPFEHLLPGKNKLKVW